MAVVDPGAVFCASAALCHVGFFLKHGLEVMIVQSIWAKILEHVKTESIFVFSPAHLNIFLLPLRHFRCKQNTNIK